MCYPQKFETVVVKFISKSTLNKPDKKTENNSISKMAKISRILPSVLLRPSKKDLEKSKFYQKKDIKLANNANNKDRCSYIQALFLNVKDILKIKENFLSLSLRKHF